MEDKTKIEKSDDKLNGTECSESALYCCNLHPYVEEYVRKGQIFPKCQKGKGHNTNWWKIVNN